MALVALPGLALPFGVGQHMGRQVPAVSNITLDAVNDVCVCTGRIITSDGASHTIDTTGSSSIQWRCNSLTFANGSTTVKVGIAAIDTANGPPPRAVNVTDVVTFDVSASLVGGGGGITANAWQAHVPDTGTKTIANGDLVCITFQMTARGGADSVQVQIASGLAGYHHPVITQNPAGYLVSNNVPCCIIQFSDGAYGWIVASEVFSAITTQTWNSGSATKEYGQLYSFPFGMKVSGLYGWVDPDNDFDFVLYSDPLGTPVAEKTTSFDLNTMANASGRYFTTIFAAPYLLKPNTPIAVVFKPGASNISTYYRTLGHADHRIADFCGLNSYGVSRASGAFANMNSSLDHVMCGLLVSHLDHSARPSFNLGI